MSRRPPKAPVPTLPPRDSEFIEEEREFEFLTPMFGGGTKVREFDPITPVRVPSVRGQLRFWWRAANPRGLQTVDDLRKAEAEIFGNTSKRSPLVLSVSKQPSRPSRMEVLHGRHGALRGLEGLAYGAFPLRGQNDEKHGVLFQFDSPEFKLRLRYPSTIQADVDAAVWAWSTLGGLGARTRRGFGAVQAKLVDGQQEPDPREGFRAHVKPAPQGWTPWPRLRQIVVGTTRYADGLDAQQSLLRTLQDMRQGEGRGRRARSGAPTPGRSYWPEPDAIRRITRRWSQMHKAPMTKVDAFPRAAFGLPIVFHFKNRREGDPDDVHLVAVDGDRWASPLVFRPWRVDTRYAAIAAELSPRPTRARIDRRGEVDVRVDASDAASLEFPPRSSSNFAPHLQFTDPLEAFLREIQGAP